MVEYILRLITAPIDKSLLNFDTVVFEDIRNEVDIDFLRDAAVRCESFDLNKVYKLMELAYRARPDGPFIKAILMEYQAKLVKELFKLSTLIKVSLR